MELRSSFFLNYNLRCINFRT